VEVLTVDDPRPNSPEDVGFIDQAARPGAAPAGSAPSPAVHEPQRCRSCDAQIWWAQVIDEKGEIQRKPDGKPRVVPVDFAPSEKGNIALARRGNAVVARVLGAERAKQIRDAAWALQGTHTLRTPHFATCPNADQWRKS
jgi:hypothetical protein